MSEQTPPINADSEPEAHYSFWYEEVGEPLTPEEVAALTPDEIEDVPPDEIIELDNGRFLRVRTTPVHHVSVDDPETGESHAIAVPGDPLDMSPEGVQLSAADFYETARHAATLVSDDQIAAYAAKLEQDDYFRALADTVTKAARETLKVSLTEADGEHNIDLSIPPEHYETAAKEATKHLHTMIAEVIEGVVLSKEDDEFRLDFARDVLHTAWAWALEEANAGIEGLREEGLLTPEASTPEARDELAEVIFENGTHITRALFTINDSMFSGLLRLVAEQIDTMQREQPETLREIVSLSWKRYAESLPAPTTTARQQRLFSAFDGNGLGKVSSGKLTHGLYLMLANATNPGMPGYTEGSNGELYYSHADMFTYSLDPLIYETADAARAAVAQLGDRHADVFDYIQALWAQNAKNIDDKVEPRIDDICEALGYSKHHKGGYRSRDRRKMRSIIDQLGHIRIDSGTIYVRETVTTKAGKRKTIEVPHRLEADKAIEVGPYLTRTGRKTSDPTHVRIGVGWAIGASLLGPKGLEYTLTSVQALALDGKSIYAKRIYHYARRIWRIRANKSGQGNVIKIRTLLDTRSGAGISLPEPRDQARFYKSVTSAFEELVSTHKPGIPPIVESIHYPDGPPNTAAPGWFSAWLESLVIITPPAQVRDRIRKANARAAQSGERQTTLLPVSSTQATE